LGIYKVRPARFKGDKSEEFTEIYKHRVGAGLGSFLAGDVFNVPASRSS
jgi:hypothetical protein